MAAPTIPAGFVIGGGPTGTCDILLAAVEVDACVDADAEEYDEVEEVDEATRTFSAILPLFETLASIGSLDCAGCEDVEGGFDCTGCAIPCESGLTAAATASLACCSALSFSFRLIKPFAASFATSLFGGLVALDAPSNGEFLGETPAGDGARFAEMAEALSSGEALIPEEAVQQLQKRAHLLKDAPHISPAVRLPACLYPSFRLTACLHRRP